MDSGLNPVYRYQETYYQEELDGLLPLWIDSRSEDL
jgi:hypothetical protein